MRHHTKAGFEISGYIDFANSIRRLQQQHPEATDWYAIFTHNKRLWPSTSDLGYYNWRSGYSVINDTENYKVRRLHEFNIKRASSDW